MWDKLNVLVTGANGFLGSNIVSLLKEKKPNKIITPTSKECDLREKSNCARIVQDVDIVFHAAGLIGGIGFTAKYPGSVFYDNLIMGAHLMEEARKANVKKFISIGTVCSYPKYTHLPSLEKDIWDGYPEETNSHYGLAKKMLIVQSDAYAAQFNFTAINIILSNLYGIKDNFSPEMSHVIPALIVKLHEAKINNYPSITLFGDGSASRDFLHITDAAQAIIMASESYNDPSPVNIGGGYEITILELTKILMKLMDLDLEILFDVNHPNGQPRRLLDISKAKNEFGWKPQIKFEEGLKELIAWYLNNPQDKTKSIEKKRILNPDLS